MIRLFEITKDYELRLNKEWIFMIPEFAQVLNEDRGSAGDTQARKKLLATKQLSYVYLMEDFVSPYRDEEEFTRHKYAMRDTGLSEAQITKSVLKAKDKYKQMLESTAPMLRTLKIVKQSREKLEEYFHDIDLTRTNAKGDLIYSTPQYIANIKQLPVMEDSIREYEEKVYAQLINETGIRGKAEKGWMEGKERELSEKGVSEDTSPQFTGMGQMIKSVQDSFKEKREE